MGLLLIDQYTLLHFVVGIVVYFWGVKFWVWTLIHIIFEYVENTAQGMRLINQIPWPGGKTHADSIINRMGDISAGSLGWLVAHWVDRMWTEGTEGPRTDTK